MQLHHPAYGDALNRHIIFTAELRHIARNKRGIVWRLGIELVQSLWQLEADWRYPDAIPLGIVLAQVAAAEGQGGVRLSSNVLGEFFERHSPVIADADALLCSAGDHLVIDGFERVRLRLRLKTATGARTTA